MHGTTTPKGSLRFSGTLQSDSSTEQPRKPPHFFEADRPIAGGPGLALGRLHAAKVAARLRGYIAEHDRKRRLRQELILALDAYCYRLKLQNMVAGRVVGRLRKIAAEYECDAERVRRQSRDAAFKKAAPLPLREAA
jgi:hypothetical protein